MKRIAPNQYSVVEENFFNFLTKNLKRELMFYVVTGSMARDDIIPGWSDIDVLVIVKKYNEKSFSIINKAFSENSSKIKIGLTLFSFDDFVNKKLYKDPKTLYSIDLIVQGICKPKICDQKLKNSISRIKSKQFYYWYDSASFSIVLHEYKRALFPMDGYNEKYIFKKLCTLLKIILKQKGIIAHGYEEILKLSVKELNGFDIRLKEPNYIMENPLSSYRHYREYIKFLDWLEKYPKF